MSTPYTVKPGDTLSAIAKQHGLASWQELYNHPDNAGFRNLRKNPDLIYPGDVVMVPSKAPTQKPAVPPTDILAAIDGTGSKDWMLPDGSNSRIFQFHRDFNTPAKLKHYEPGPNTLGLDVGAITDTICQFITTQHQKASNPRLTLIGHSRGGLIAILAARRLGLPVDFMGLYDAVDRHYGPSAEKVPGCVRVCYHAIRDPSVQSRVYFGNCGRQAEAGVDYHEEPFRSTHGGIGGSPEGGDNETLHNVVLSGLATVVGGVGVGVATYTAIRTTIDLATDQSESQRADTWIRDAARSQGLPLA